MYDILKHAHSGLRWLTLAFLVFAVLNAIIKWTSNGTFTDRDRKLNTFALIFTHVQILIGLVLYVVGGQIELWGSDIMSQATTRFYVLEHPLTMIVAAVLITIGNARAKRASTDKAKFRTTAIFFGIGLLLILSRIPWPTQFPGAGWY